MNKEKTATWKVFDAISDHDSSSFVRETLLARPTPNIEINRLATITDAKVRQA